MTVCTDTIQSLLSKADMENWEFIWTSQIRSRTTNPAQFAEWYVLAEKITDVKGGMSYEERKAVNDLRPRGFRRWFR